MLYELHGVSKAYDGKVVLDIPNLDIEESKILAVVGPNGSGKTTLLRLLALIEPLTGGDIIYRGVSVGGPGVNLNELRRDITFVMENPYLFHMSVRSNVIYPLRVRSIPSSGATSMVDGVLDLFDLFHLTHSRARSLSAGQRQRVALARAFVSGAGTILLDEPTANIDRENVGRVEENLVWLNRERGTSVIFTTHDLAQAYRLADEVVMLIDGQLSGTKPENVFSGLIADLDGTKCMEIAPGVTFELVTERVGKGYISIDPESIIISLCEVDSSARNTFRGRIVRVEEDGERIRVVVNIGAILVVFLTKKSFFSMGLNVGREVWLTFKALSVKVH